MPQPLNNFNKSKAKTAATNVPLPGLEQDASTSKEVRPAPTKAEAPKTTVAKPETTKPAISKVEPAKAVSATKSEAAAPVKTPPIATPKKSSIVTGASIDFITHSVAQTQQAGERLGQILRAGDVILLEGDLGAGKTTITKGIAKGLGVEGYVNSPTFTLVNEYRNGRLWIYHLDCYRLESAAEALDFGIEEYIYGDGVTLIEWPQRIAEILPAENLRVKMTYLADNKRSIRLEPSGTRYAQLVAEFKKIAFGA